MGVFMSIMFVVGLVLTIFAFKISADVKGCSENVQNAARGLLVMGVIFLSVSATYAVCGCGASKVAHSSIGSAFILLMAVLGVITTSLTAVIHNGCPDARKSTPVLLTLAVIATALSVGVLGYKGYKSMSFNIA